LLSLHFGGFTIKAETDSCILVDATDFLLRGAMKAANRIKAAQQGVVKRRAVEGIECCHWLYRS